MNLMTHYEATSNARRGCWRVFTLALLVLGVLAGAILSPVGAGAATPSTDGADWLPFVGTVKVNCSYQSAGGICGSSYHPWWAIDFGLPAGTWVRASGRATVYQVKSDCVEGDMHCGAGYGNYVVLHHQTGEKRYSVYAHLQRGTLSVSRNDVVSAGQALGKSGSTGNSTGPHLHYEERLTFGSIGSYGNAVDPQYLRGLTTVGQSRYPTACGYSSWKGIPGSRCTVQNDGTTSLPASSWEPVGNGKVGASACSTSTFAVCLPSGGDGGIWSGARTKEGVVVPKVACDYRIKGQARLRRGAGYGFAGRVSFDAGNVPTGRAFQYDAGARGYRDVEYPSDHGTTKPIGTLDSEWHTIVVRMQDVSNTQTNYAMTVDGTGQFSGTGTSVPCGSRLFIRVWSYSGFPADTIVELTNLEMRLAGF